MKNANNLKHIRIHLGPRHKESGTTLNSEYPATLRSAQIAPCGRNFGYSRNVSAPSKLGSSCKVKVLTG